MAQLAWLACAGSGIGPQVDNALDGMIVLRRDGKPPRSPVAYLRGCLNELVGTERLEFLLGKAPARAACEHITEGQS